MSTATYLGIRNVDAELEREGDLVAERFPDVPRATIDEAVRRTYHELAATATVRAHLFTITGSVVMNRLRAEGATYRPPNYARPTSSPRA
jgi:Protein-tyrosine-phosphatase-like, N-terminal domain